MGNHYKGAGWKMEFSGTTNSTLADKRAGGAGESVYSQKTW